MNRDWQNSWNFREYKRSPRSACFKKVAGGTRFRVLMPNCSCECMLNMGRVWPSSSTDLQHCAAQGESTCFRACVESSEGLLECGVYQINTIKKPFESLIAKSTFCSPRSITIDDSTSNAIRFDNSLKDLTPAHPISAFADLADSRNRINSNLRTGTIR